MRNRQPEIFVRILEVAKAFWSKGNDWVLGIRTMPHGFRVTQLAREKLQELNGSSVGTMADDSSGYESPDYANLRKIVSFVDPKPHDVVFDLGSGMGRVLCLFARRQVMRCVGVELFPSLCEIAEENSRTLKGRQSPIEIWQNDVAQADFSSGTIFFLFNPFGLETMGLVLNRIHDLCYDPDQPIKIIYYKDLHADVLETCSWLKKYHEMKTFSGINVSFWQSV